MIRVFQPQITVHDRCAVQAVLESGMIGPGAACREFETLLADYTGVKHVVLCNSGSTALLLALMAMRSPRDRTETIVFCPDYGMHAGSEAALLLRYPVELYDVDESPWLHPNRIVLRINQNGLPGSGCDIEDACQSMGVPGCFHSGSVATLSFSPQKLVTTGQGGAVLTDDDFLAERIRGLVDHGGNWRQTRIHDQIGGNFRMPDLLAAMGVSQMRRIDEIVATRERIHAQYRELLPAVECGWCVIHRSDDARSLIHYLRDHHIEALQPYRPVHHHPPFACTGHFPNAERCARELVYLPGHNGLTESNIATICRRVQEFEHG